MSRKNPKKKKKAAAKSRKRLQLTAATSDKHDLYEQSVQDTEAECDFIDQVWKERRKRLATHVREDFCGTAATSCEWIKRRDGNTAIGVDNDPGVLSCANERIPNRLDEEQIKRLKILEADVLTVKTKKVESVLAMNFSYYLFKTRDLLGKYFKRVRTSLVDDGIFILDAYGGSDSFVELEEDRKVKGFTYVWDQNSYDPITGDVTNYIHFRFPDGSAMNKAFEYHWRLWTLPELTELLEEAGFNSVTIYWEGNDEDGDGNGEFKPATVGEACEGWIAYIVAEK